MKQIDLHVHSTCSDGTDSPAVLVDKAVDKGLAAFALTDHDTTRGVKEALLLGKISKQRYDSYVMMYEQCKEKRRY